MNIGDILENFGDIIDHTTESWASNIQANATADQARANAIAASVSIAQAKARGEERRKEEQMKIVKIFIYTLLSLGVLSTIMLFIIKTKK